MTKKNRALTVDNFSISSSEAPSDASPISCENWANALSANSGMCPSSSWMQSLCGTNGHRGKCDYYFVRTPNPSRVIIAQSAQSDDVLPCHSILHYYPLNCNIFYIDDGVNC